MYYNGKIRLIRQFNCSHSFPEVSTLSEKFRLRRPSEFIGVSYNFNFYISSINGRLLFIFLNLQLKMSR